MFYRLHVLFQYNTGKFDEARGYVEQAMDTMVRVLPEDHVLNASSKRVMALILEEIAIDSVGTPAEQELLILAEKIHLSCIKLTGNVFGELNVQTAKHYGNLGRLYQTMKKYRVSFKVFFRKDIELLTLAHDMFPFPRTRRLCI